jgi:nicotinamidase-related amidase
MQIRYAKVCQRLVVMFKLGQCVLGTIVDAYFRGYDVAVVKDCTATSSPKGGLDNVFHNSGNVSLSTG